MLLIILMKDEDFYSLPQNPSNNYSHSMMVLIENKRSDFVLRLSFSLDGRRGWGMRVIHFGIGQS
jgi:hypothetical protein